MNGIVNLPIYDSRYIDCYRDTKTGELSFKLSPSDKYLPYTSMEVLYEIPGRGFFRVKRKISHYFDYKLYHDLRTGEERDPQECREIVEECSLILARYDAAFRFCYLGKVIVKEVRL